MMVIGRPACCATVLAGMSAVSASTAMVAPMRRPNHRRAFKTVPSTDRRLGGKRRAAHAHPAARILPQLLSRMQVADGARDGVEIVLRETLGDVGVVERLLLDCTQNVLCQRRHLGVIPGTASIVLL